MSQGQPNKHTQDQGAWTFCARCGDRVPIKDMQWQRGKLLDAKCFDSFPLLGQIDKGIADALSNIILSPDLQPDPKLTLPTLDGQNDDIFI
jgi:hypothetical protein